MIGTSKIPPHLSAGVVPTWTAAGTRAIVVAAIAPQLAAHQADAVGRAPAALIQMSCTSVLLCLGGHTDGVQTAAVISCGGHRRVPISLRVATAPPSALHAQRQHKPDRLVQRWLPLPAPLAMASRLPAPLQPRHAGSCASEPSSFSVTLCQAAACYALVYRLGALMHTTDAVIRGGSFLHDVPAVINNIGTRRRNMTRFSHRFSERLGENHAHDHLSGTDPHSTTRCFGRIVDQSSPPHGRATYLHHLHGAWVFRPPINTSSHTRAGTGS